ncbi:MAG: cysteine protease StiP family protein [Micromonosporaceae bacterium]|nr:cysteine protease StiP family protein [Micromonosporaceae bacterium]
MIPQPLHGPEFSSYASQEVTWLLTDLSSADLEAPAVQREVAVQSGVAHYSESLPIEYQPTEEYLTLFHQTLERSATRVARAVAVVCESVLAGRRAPVLVSLARAGTPIGILLRRWAEYAHETQLPHYTISIVRGRGIDRVALRYLAERHDPARIVFVDGWTGKGSICRELGAALATVAREDTIVFDPNLAVLADPGRCAAVFGTRDDFLVPSACLNATVSGLVSRTVLNDRLIGPGRFHGAKCYRHLAGVDVSALFLDAVTARFRAVAAAVARSGPYAPVADPNPDWAGWHSARALCHRYGLPDVNLVKPGVGETTRVLLRRVPWRVLVRPETTADLAHVLMLARDRDVPVEPVADLPYACVGLVRPWAGHGSGHAPGHASGHASGHAPGEVGRGRG